MVFSILASDHGYKAVEIGRFLDKDPTRVTRCLQARDEVQTDVREAARFIQAQDSRSDNMKKAAPAVGL